MKIGAMNHPSRNAVMPTALGGVLSSFRRFAAGERPGDCSGPGPRTERLGKGKASRQEPAPPNEVPNRWPRAVRLASWWRAGGFPTRGGGGGR
jgi:hypothetical protein